MHPPLRLHPRNPKLFEFRGQPRVLLTATEHYGAVMNRPFQFERYLADAAQKGMTLTRLFTLFRELQTPINPYSTCKPETPDLITPFLRTGPGRAQDLELKFDLDRPNPEFFDRLDRYLALASSYGIVVEVVLVSNTYQPAIWDLNPLNARNNINGLEEIPWPHYLSQRNPRLFERQAAHARRIVEAVNPYDNVLIEICNEPGGAVDGSADNPSTAEVNAWLTALIGIVRQTESGLANRHLVAGQEAFSYQPTSQDSDLAFATMGYDVVNMHPLPKLVYGGQTYELGDFMSKQLALRPLRDYGLATYAAPKPLNQDEDNIASQYKDNDAWTIHRKRAWTVLLTGGHYDYIDFSISNGFETGTPASQNAIRTWFRILSEFIHSLDLVRARPLPGLLTAQPPHTLEVAFGIPGEDLCIYLADERELAAARGLTDGDNLDRGAGQPISGNIQLSLPPDRYQVTILDPKTGAAAPAAAIEAGAAPVTIAVPAFTHDVVIRIRRASPLQPSE
ncbi:MAG: hypothetical protein ABI847_02515 [Anaerolineales bacterium]